MASPRCSSGESSCAAMLQSNAGKSFCDWAGQPLTLLGVLRLSRDGSDLQWRYCPDFKSRYPDGASARQKKHLTIKRDSIKSDAFSSTGREQGWC